MKWIFLAVFAGIGLPALIGAAAWGFKRWRLAKEGLRTFGTVVDFFESLTSGNRGTSRSYFPEVQCTTPDGQTHRFRGSTGSSSPDYQKGQRVAVIYRREDPAQAQVADFEQFWLGPLIVGVFGLIFTAAGVGGFVSMRGAEKVFDPYLNVEMIRAELVDGKRGIALPATVESVKVVPGKNPTYMLICRGGAPGGAQRGFMASPLAFDPGPGVIGKPVTVYVDPINPNRFYVQVEPLFAAPPRP